jgi:hypothetical protein
VSGLYASTRRSDRVNTPPAPPPDPESTFGAVFGASRRNAVDEVTTIQEQRLASAYAELWVELEGLGVPRERLRRAAPADDVSARHSWRLPPNLAVAGTAFYELDRDAVWREVAALAVRHPELMAERGATRDIFERNVLRRFGDRDRDQRVVANGSAVGGTAAMFAGGMVGSLADPVNIATLPLGIGGPTVMRAAANGALINGLLAAMQLPVLDRNLETLGEELTPGMAAFNVAVSAGAGGAFSGGARAIELRGPGVREAALARIYPMLPESIRNRWANASDIPDYELANVLEGLRGDALTPDEVDAIAAVRREQEVTPPNPFIPNAAGQEMFDANMADAMARILRDSPVRPVTLPTGISTRARLASGTAAGSDVVNPVRGNAARQAVRSRIGQVESSGGRNYANPLSSARGLYQFIDGTWLAYYRRRYGADGRSDSEVLALRRDTRLQNILMDDLLDDNARFLAREGEAETAGNLYLVHFAGQGGARRLFRADPNAPVGQVLGQQAVRANRFLRGMTAGDVIAWAHRRMNDAPPARADGRARPAGYDVDDPQQAALALELERIEAERARLDEEAAALDREAAGREIDTDVARLGDDAGRALDEIDDADVPVSIADDVGEVRLPREDVPARGADDAGPVPDADPLAPVVARTRALITDTRVGLNDMGRLVRRLDASEAEIRQAMARLAAEGLLVARAVREGKGRNARVVGQRYLRPPSRVPRDAFELIASMGGLRGGGRHQLEGRFMGSNGRPMFTRFGPLVRVPKRQLDADGQELAVGLRTSEELAPGLSPDEVGELLFSNGYLSGRDYDGVEGRATEAEVLEYLEELFTSGRRGYTVEEQMRRDALGADEDGRFADVENEVGGHLAALGLEPDSAMVRDVADEMVNAQARGEPISIDEAYVNVANTELLDEITAVWKDALDDPDYQRALAAILDEGAGEGIDGRAADAGTPSERGADPYDAADRDAFDESWEIADDGWRATGELDDGALWRDAHYNHDWTDPGGVSAKAQADSLSHDARVVLGEPAPPALLRQDQIAEDLRAGGWTEDGPYKFSKRIDGYADGGSVSDGARVVRIVIDPGTSRISRVDGWGQSQDFVRFQDYRVNPQAALDTVIYRGSMLEAEKLRADPAPPARAAAADDMFGGATRDEARQALERQMEGGLAAPVPQRAAGADGGLFDTEAVKQMQFLLDEDGDMRNLADIMAALDADDAALRALRDCL